MGKNKERKAAKKKKNGKPKHSLHLNRSNNGKGCAGSGARTAATVRRLKMYADRPKRNRKGKVLKHDFQSKNLPSTRIESDPRWFGNTRVIDQKQLELLREDLQNQMPNNYIVIIKGRKLLPMALLK